MKLSLYIGYLGGVFLLLIYLAELVLLFLNPVNVMGPNIERYVLYHHLLTLRNSKIAWDVSCWLLDFKKELGYAFILFYFNLFNFVIFNGRPISKFGGDKTCEARLNMIFPSLSVPIYLVISIIAMVFVYVLCPAAINFNSDTSIWKVFLSQTGFMHPFFFLYRIFFPCIVFLFSLHYITFIYSAFKEHSPLQFRIALPQISIYIVIFIMIIKVLYVFLFSQAYKKAIFGNLIVVFATLILLGISVMAFFKISKRVQETEEANSDQVFNNDNLGPKDRWFINGDGNFFFIIKNLTRVNTIPILFLSLPFISIFFISLRSESNYSLISDIKPSINIFSNDNNANNKESAKLIGYINWLKQEFDKKEKMCMPYKFTNEMLRLDSKKRDDISKNKNGEDIDLYDIACLKIKEK